MDGGRTAPTDSRQVDEGEGMTLLARRGAELERHPGTPTFAGGVYSWGLADARRKAA